MSTPNLFRAFADPTRLRILNLLREQDELCVCDLCNVLGESQPKVSRHLATLRAAGIVESRRDGSWVYYRLIDQADGERERQLRGLIGSFSKRRSVGRDLKHLVKRRGPESCKQPGSRERE